MTTWRHACCDDCWDRMHPGALSQRVGRGEMERCSFCGFDTTSGIYVRMSPEEVVKNRIVKPFRIESIHAFTCIGDDDQEGVVAFMKSDGSWMPMIAANPERLEQLRPLAQHVADVRQTPVRLRRFETVVEVETLEPQPIEMPIVTELPDLGPGVFGTSGP